MRYVIELAITVFVAAYLLPQAISAIAGANVTGWNAAVVTIFTILLPILVIVSVALALMPKELKSKAGF
jgi:predicted membrane channel-forming protein YqfA (hemolysin III family)